MRYAPIAFWQEGQDSTITAPMVGPGPPVAVKFGPAALVISAPQCGHLKTSVCVPTMVTLPAVQADTRL